jgi:RNA polymerase sigma-70 factor (ECF subfamily)
MRTRNALARHPIAKFRSLNPQSDEILIKSIAAGDQAAMRSLYSRHNDRVLRFIIRIVTDAGCAEDLVAEVFIDVWSQADRFEGRSQVLTWILSIARHKALSSLLAQRRRRVAEVDDTAMEMIVDTADTPEQTLLDQDCGAQLRTCLAQMSREHREIIDLVYYLKSVEFSASFCNLDCHTWSPAHRSANLTAWNKHTPQTMGAV